MSQPPEDELRVSTLEIFFDLVFAFTLTQLTALLASHLSWPSVGRVLLVFGLLWWMYEAYAWLTNTRPPVHRAERLLLLLGMAGFLVIGLAIPSGFASYAVVLGLGYLVVVLVHAALYYRVNANILRVAPFNVASAVLVTTAGLLRGAHGTTTPAGYALWVAALAVQLGSPLIVHPAGRFDIRAAHFCERHSALLIVAIGESVAAVGIGAAGPASRGGPPAWHLLASAVLGLAVAAALWWMVFGSGDDESAVVVMRAASGDRRAVLALNVFFYGNIPLLLGLIAMAAGILRAVVQATGPGVPPAGSGPAAAQALVLGGGAALFLAGDVISRWQLGTGPFRVRAAAAGAAVATAAVGTFAGLNAQLVLVAAVLIAPLLLERGPGERGGSGNPEAEAAPASGPSSAGGPGAAGGTGAAGRAVGPSPARGAIGTAGEAADGPASGDAAG
jgi:low temperature requirement protein LtrA